MLSAGGVARTYDDGGRTLTAGATTYTWGPEDRLVGADTGAQVLAFEYNLDGIRVSKDVDGCETEYVLDSNRAYAEVIEERGTVGLQASYVHGQDLMSQARRAAQSFYHADGIGSTRALTDGAQRVSDSYAYEAFGDLVGASGRTANRYLFTGEQLDAEMRLSYVRARYYQPEAGRFLSEDPYIGTHDSPSSLMRYVYSNDAPTNYTDRSGATVDAVMSAGQLAIGVQNVGQGAVLAGSQGPAYAAQLREFRVDFDFTQLGGLPAGLKERVVSAVHEKTQARFGAWKQNIHFGSGAGIRKTVRFRSGLLSTNRFGKTSPGSALAEVYVGQILLDKRKLLDSAESPDQRRYGGPNFDPLIAAMSMSTAAHEILHTFPVSIAGGPDGHDPNPCSLFGQPFLCEFESEPAWSRSTIAAINAFFGAH